MELDHGTPIRSFVNRHREAPFPGSRHLRNAHSEHADPLGLREHPPTPSSNPFGTPGKRPSIAGTPADRRSRSSSVSQLERELRLREEGDERSPPRGGAGVRLGWDVAHVASNTREGVKMCEVCRMQWKNAFIVCLRFVMYDHPGYP